MISSVRFVFPSVVVMAIGLYHMTSAASVPIPGFKCSSVSRRSTIDRKMEYIERMLNAEMLRKRHERKSLSEDDEDDDEDDGSGSGVSSPVSEWMIQGLKAIRKKSYPVAMGTVDKAAKKEKPENRDYFAAIGIAPHRRFHP